MSNSSLVTYKYPKSTTHYNNREHAIDRITIHHAANGTGCNKGYGDNTLQVIFDSCGRAGSVQYGIDSNGRIGQMLDEKYRSWCSDSRSNDTRAITIEVANCAGAPNYEISDKAMHSLISLCADICRRNGIKALSYTGDKTCKTGNMTLHKWFAATPCPGPYLESKMPYIASEVNKLLGAKTPDDPQPAFTPYLIKVTYSQGLNIRSGPGVNYKKVGTVPCGGVYTIVAEQKNGTQTWGKLKSGAGWICLTGFTQKYTKK